MPVPNNNIIHTDVFIGGPADGQKIAVPPSAKAWRIQQFVNPDGIALIEEIERGRFSEPAYYDHVYYRESLYVRPGFEYTFFRYSETTMSEAIWRLFSWYGERGDVRATL